MTRSSAKQAQEVIALNRLGMPILDITHTLKLPNVKETRRILRRALREYCAEACEDIREQELDRLARIEAQLWPLATNNPHDPNNVAFGRLLRCMEMRLEWSGCRPAIPKAVVQDNSLKIQIVNFLDRGEEMQELPGEHAALPAPTEIAGGAEPEVEVEEEDAPAADLPQELPREQDEP